jgi:ATP-binding cassette subfamily B (MDR/TAP) protein 1
MHAESDSPMQTRNADCLHEKDLTVATDGAGLNGAIHDETGKHDAEGKLSAPAAYFRLWTYAYPLDVILRVIATAAALGGGSAYPLMTLIFGNLVNAFNNTGVLSPSEFRSTVNRDSLWFLYLFIGKFGVRILLLVGSLAAS